MFSGALKWEHLSEIGLLDVCICQKMSKHGYFSGPYSVRKRENTDQKKLRICILFTQCYFMKVLTFQRFAGNRRCSTTAWQVSVFRVFLVRIFFIQTDLVINRFKFLYSVRIKISEYGYFLGSVSKQFVQKYFPRFIGKKTDSESLFNKNASLRPKNRNPL